MSRSCSWRTNRVRVAMISTGSPARTAAATTAAISCVLPPPVGSWTRICRYPALIARGISLRPASLGSRDRQAQRFRRQRVEPIDRRRPCGCLRPEAGTRPPRSSALMPHPPTPVLRRCASSAGSLGNKRLAKVWDRGLRKPFARLRATPLASLLLVLKIGIGIDCER